MQEHIATHYTGTESGYHPVKGSAEWGSLTLRQACSLVNQGAQCAFKILMIHEVLQFALRIAFRCVLHRCGSLDIHC